MYLTTSYKKISLKLLFVLGAILGAVVFIAIYGVRILDCTYNGWLFYGDNDLRQHYIAWCNFRRDPWHFPIGLVDSLSYPHSMSVIYTDSIPIVAVIFKLFAPILPVTFQYFGWYGIVTFMLMGGLSAILLARFNEDPIICVAGSGFFVISFQMIHRMYYHSALASQWIIILALIFWVYDEKIKGIARKSLCWALMGFLCVGIHSYFLPMVGMILAALMVQQFVLVLQSMMKNKESKENLKDSLDTDSVGKIIKKKAELSEIYMALKLPITEFLSFCVSGIVMLYVLGGFYGGTSSYGYGLGTFGANLNTFINPIGFGKLMPRLPLFYDFQYEGFGYLGCGILFLYFSIAVGLIFRLSRKVPESAFHSNKIYGRLTLAVLVVSFMSASLPLLSYGDKKIIWVPYPGFVERILGIFRSNGRFIWVAVYILMVAAISFVAYTFRHNRFVAVMLIFAALVLQMIDQSDVFKEKREYFANDEHTVHTMWDNPELTALTVDKDEFIFLYTDNDWTMLTAYYGYINGMHQNNFYYARDIDSIIREDIDKYLNELKNGQMRDNVVYVITEQMYYEDLDFYNCFSDKSALVDGHFVFTK